MKVMEIHMTRNKANEFKGNITCLKEGKPIVIPIAPMICAAFLERHGHNAVVEMIKSLEALDGDNN